MGEVFLCKTCSGAGMLVVLRHQRVARRRSFLIASLHGGAFALVSSSATEEVMLTIGLAMGAF